MSSLLRGVDCIELYVDDLDAGISYYCHGLGLSLLWRTEDSAGLGLREGLAEVVLQTERRHMTVDFLVDSAADAAKQIEALGGKVLHGPFDIPIGACVVVEDPWGNAYVLLDMHKGRYRTDDAGNVMGVEADPLSK